MLSVPSLLFSFFIAMAGVSALCLVRDLLSRSRYAKRFQSRGADDTLLLFNVLLTIFCFLVLPKMWQ